MSGLEERSYTVHMNSSPSLGVSVDSEPSRGEAPPSVSTSSEENSSLAIAPEDEEFVESPVNYDEPGLFEAEIEEILYRFDAGKQGTALCLSRREPGSWRWAYLGELRWDGRDLRSRALERKLLQQLSIELRRFVVESAS